MSLRSRFHPSVSPPGFFLSGSASRCSRARLSQSELERRGMHVANFHTGSGDPASWEGDGRERRMSRGGLTRRITKKKEHMWDRREVEIGLLAATLIQLCRPPPHPPYFFHPIAANVISFLMIDLLSNQTHFLTCQHSLTHSQVLLGPCPNFIAPSEGWIMPEYFRTSTCRVCTSFAEEQRGIKMKSAVR